jgi:hypothetical protein
MNKRYILWAALLIAAVIVVRPMFWLGLIGFIGLMIALAIFVGLVVIYLISLKKGSVYREIGFGILIIVMICAAIALKFSAPELNASEVKTQLSYPPTRQQGITGYYFLHDGQTASSAEYRGGGIWKVGVRSVEGRQDPPYVFEGNEDIGHEGQKYLVEGDIYYLYYNENTRETKIW